MLLRTLIDCPQNVGYTGATEVDRILDDANCEAIPSPRYLDIKIGFFPNTPFPSWEIYRSMLLASYVSEALSTPE